MKTTHKWNQMQIQLCIPASAERCGQTCDLAGILIDRNGQHCQITRLMEQQHTTEETGVFTVNRIMAGYSKNSTALRIEAAFFSVKLLWVGCRDLVLKDYMSVFKWQLFPLVKYYHLSLYFTFVASPIQNNASIPESYHSEESAWNESTPNCQGIINTSHHFLKALHLWCWWELCLPHSVVRTDECAHGAQINSL